MYKVDWDNFESTTIQIAIVKKLSLNNIDIMQSVRLFWCA